MEYLTKFLTRSGAKTKKLRNKRKMNNKSSKKINCSPIVKGKTVNKDTCYTQDILFKIRDAYNEGHNLEEKITTNDPNEIWNILHDRLAMCEKEDCWLRKKLTNIFLLRICLLNGKKIRMNGYRI